MMPNITQQVLAYFGVLKAGGVIVNINPTYTAREVQHLLKDSGAQTIVTLTGLHARIEEVRAQTAIKTIILTDIVDSLAWLWKKVAAKPSARQRHDGRCCALPRTFTISMS